MPSSPAPSYSFGMLMPMNPRGPIFLMASAGKVISSSHCWAYGRKLALGKFAGDLAGKLLLSRQFKIHSSSFRIKRSLYKIKMATISKVH